MGDAVAATTSPSPDCSRLALTVEAAASPSQAQPLRALVLLATLSLYAKEEWTDAKTNFSCMTNSKIGVFIIG